MKEERKNGQEFPEKAACPFCRTPPTNTEQEFIDRIHKGVERNEAYSMEQLAMYYLDGNGGLQQDITKAEELLRKAGEQGCASAYSWLGKIYSEGSEEDTHKEKHFLGLGAIGGCMESRHNLAVFECSKGNNIRACKHFLICAKAGYETSLDGVKLGFQHGIITTDEYTEALRAYQKQQEDRKSALRDEASDFLVNRKSAMRDKAFVHRANP